MKKAQMKRKAPTKRRRRNKIGADVYLSKYNSPLVKMLKASMMYTVDAPVTLISAAGNPGTRVYSLNGLYDVDQQAGGHQPRGFDEIMELYTHYVVINAKVRIDCFNNNTNVGAYIVATIRDDNTTSPNYLDYMESSNSNWRLLAAESAGGGTKTINLNINPNAFLGRSKPMADPELKGTAAANPQEQAFLHISAFSHDLFTASNVQCMVTFEFTTLFIEPRQPGQS